MRKKLLNFYCFSSIFLGLLEMKSMAADSGEVSEEIVFTLDPKESVQQLQERLSALAYGENHDRPIRLLIEIPQEGDPIGILVRMTRKHGDYLGHCRNYEAEVTPAERRDIHMIITTLATKGDSIFSLLFAKNALEAAGNRIDHLHPLRFFQVIFTDEQLKAGIKTIRAKGWLWSHFISSAKDCLNTESRIGNMKEEYIHHFAQSIGIDAQLILPALNSYNWDLFIDQLLTHVSRQGDPNRFDF